MSAAMAAFDFEPDSAVYDRWSPRIIRSRVRYLVTSKKNGPSSKSNIAARVPELMKSQRFPPRNPLFIPI